MDESDLEEEDAAEGDNPILVGSVDANLFHEFVEDTLAVSVTGRFVHESRIWQTILINNFKEYQQQRI